jgi:hypothetical protein
VRANPSNVMSALVDVVAPGGQQAWVEHGDTTAYGDSTRPASLSPNGQIVIPIIGLAPGAPNHLRVHVTGAAGAAAQTEDVVFNAGPLPDGVPASLAVVKGSKAVSGCVLVGLHHEKRESFVAVLVDRNGRVRWYWVAPPPVTAAAQFDRVRGNFLVVDGSQDAFYEIDLAGTIVKTWKDPGSPQGLDGHDFLLLPNGNAMMIGWEFRSVDSRPFFAKGKKTAIRADHTIDEVDPTGSVRFHWSSYGNVGLDEVIEGPRFDPTNFHVVHANSLEITRDGNLLASFRSTSSIFKIDRSNGHVMWRLGGKKSDFRFVGDPSSGFSRQHDPHFLENGELMVFDNGNQHAPPVSRVVRYALDESARTAQLTWEYRHDPDVFSEIAGSARVLPNGNVLIGWVNGLITEVDRSRNVVWEAKTAELAIYRALYTPSLYP